MNSTKIRFFQDLCHYFQVWKLHKTLMNIPLYYIHPPLLIHTYITQLSTIFHKCDAHIFRPRNLQSPVYILTLTCTIISIESLLSNVTLSVHTRIAFSASYFESILIGILSILMCEDYQHGLISRYLRPLHPFWIPFSFLRIYPNSFIPPVSDSMHILLDSIRFRPFRATCFSTSNGITIYFYVSQIHSCRLRRIYTVWVLKNCITRLKKRTFSLFLTCLFAFFSIREPYCSSPIYVPIAHTMSMPRIYPVPSCSHKQ